MTLPNYIITQYPLSTSYTEQFRETITDRVEQIIVSNVTARGYLDVLRYFRRLRADTIYLPVVDYTARSLIPPFELLALITPARRRVVVNPDFSIEDFGLVDGVLSAAAIIAGIIVGGATLLVSWFRLSRLERLPRVRVSRNSRRRVLYLKTNLWLGVQAGGSVAHTSGVIGGLLERGHEVDFASAETPVALPRRDDLHLHRIRPPGAYVVPREMNHYRHHANTIRSLSRMSPGRYGFIYQRFSLGNFAGVVLSRLRRLPLVLEYNGSEVWLARNWGTPLLLERLAEMAERVCLRHAHLIVTVSDVLRDQLIARGIEPERIVAYPNGVDTAVFRPDRFSPRQIAAVRRRLGISADATVATFAGTFGHWHGAEVLARALGALARRGTEWLQENKVHVVFIGDGVKRPVFEKILADADVAPFFTLTGLIAQEDTPLYMAASDILVSPHVPNPDGSPFFGSPTKLFEYLATGRPVVASQLNQIGEVLVGCPHVRDLAGADSGPAEGACGVVATPENVDELAAALRFLVENPEWRRVAGDNARRRALTRYTWGHHVDAILGGLQGLLEREAERARLSRGRRGIRLLVNGLHSKSGGGVTYLRNVLPILSRDPGVEVSLCIHEDQKGVLPADLDGVRVHYLTFKPGFWRLQLHEQIDLPKLARRIGAEVTFSPANYGPVLAPNSIVLLRNALSVAFVERRLVKLLYWAGVYLATVFSMMACRRAIAVSDYAKASAGAGVLGLLRDRITVIPHGVSSLFSPPNGTARRKRFLLAVSDIYVQKNLRNLLLAVAKLRRDDPGVLLKIAGRPVDEDYHRSLHETAERLGLEGNVEFLGEVGPSKLVTLYRQCAVFVFPSNVETFGNPLVEAMACGAPIASSGTAAMPEVLGDAALYFDPADIDGMAAAIERLQRDRKLRTQLSKKAIERSRHYSWDATVARTLDVIREVAPPV